MLCAALHVCVEIYDADMSTPVRSLSRRIVRSRSFHLNRQGTVNFSSSAFSPAFKKAGDTIQRAVKPVAQLRCYSKEASSFVSKPSGRRGSGRNTLGTIPEGETSDCGSPSSGSTSPSGRRGGRRLVQTTELASAARARLQERMFGARRGAYAHSDAAARLLARRVQGQPLSFREGAFLFLEEPGASKGAFYFAVATWTLLLLSALLAACRTLSTVQAAVPTVVFISAEVTLNVLFTLEAMTRVATYQPALTHAIRSPILWLDVLTVVPFWLRVSIDPTYFRAVSFNARAPGDLDFFLRVAESLASLRLLKLARYYEGAELLQRAMARAASQLLVPMFMLFIMVVCFSGLLIELEWDATIDRCIDAWVAQGVSRQFIHSHRDGVKWSCAVCEQPDPTIGTAALLEHRMLCLTCPGHPEGQPECLGRRWTQQYTDMPTAMWFLLVSVTPAVKLDPTVYPMTWYGKFFIVVVIVFGILFLAMPLSTVGSAFNHVWNERQMIKLQRLVRQLLVENGKGADDCKVAFAQFDANGSGDISFQEFVKCVQEVLGLHLPRGELVRLWHRLDEGRLGTVTINQFTDAIFPNVLSASEDLMMQQVGKGRGFSRRRTGPRTHFAQEAMTPSVLDYASSAGLHGQPSSPPSTSSHQRWPSSKPRSPISSGSDLELNAKVANLTSAVEGVQGQMSYELAGVRSDFEALHTSLATIYDALQRLSNAPSPEQEATRTLAPLPQRTPSPQRHGRLKTRSMSRVRMLETNASFDGSSIGGSHVPHLTDDTDLLDERDLAAASDQRGGATKDSPPPMGILAARTQTPARAPPTPADVSSTESGTTSSSFDA